MALVETAGFVDGIMGFEGKEAQHQPGVHFAPQGFGEGEIGSLGRRCAIEPLRLVAPDLADEIVILAAADARRRERRLLPERGGLFGQGLDQGGVGESSNRPALRVNLLAQHVGIEGGQACQARCGKTQFRGVRG